MRRAARKSVPGAFFPESWVGDIDPVETMLAGNRRAR